VLEQHFAEVQARVAALQQSMQVLALKIAHYRAIEANAKRLSRPPSSGTAPERKTSD